MTSTTPDPVISGVPYAVREVDGAAPTSLEDFVGEHRVILERGPDTHVVQGTGSAADAGSVRFHEKGAETTKDVRPWRVLPGDDGGFTAASGVY